MKVNVKNQTHTRISKGSKAKLIRWGKKRGYKSIVETLDVVIKRCCK